MGHCHTIHTSVQLGHDRYWILGTDADIREQKDSDIDILVDNVHLFFFAMIPQMQLSIVTKICNGY